MNARLRAEPLGYDAHGAGSVVNVERLPFGKTVAKRWHEERSSAADRGFHGFDQEIQPLLVRQGGKLRSHDCIRMNHNHAARLDANRQQSIGDGGRCDVNSSQASCVSCLLLICVICLS